MRGWRLSFSPVIWVTIEKLTQQVLWIILFAILAPILGPRPYGLFSIVMVFVGFCEFVLSEGAVEALVTVDEMEQAHTATANLANGLIAVGLGCLLFLAAAPIAASFHSGELRPLIWSLIPLPILSLLSAAPIAELRRSLQYKRLAIRSIIGLLIGGAFGIVLALAGAGVWALAGQVLVQRGAEVTIAWASVPLRFRFGWSSRHFHEMKSIALNVYAARAMIFGNGQLPRLIIGYVLGPTAVGLFTIASRFLDIITSTAIIPRALVGRIELRTLAPGSREFDRRFSLMIQDASILSLPIMVGIASIMPQLFAIWLDQRWLPAVVPAQLIALSGLPMVLFFCCDAGFLGARRSSVFTRTATIQVLSVATAVICFAPFGLVAVCAALAVRPWLLTPLYLFLCRRPFRPARLSVLGGATAVAVGSGHYGSDSVPAVPALPVV